MLPPFARTMAPTQAFNLSFKLCAFVSGELSVERWPSTGEAGVEAAAATAAAAGRARKPQQLRQLALLAARVVSTPVLADVGDVPRFSSSFATDASLTDSNLRYWLGSELSAHLKAMAASASLPISWYNLPNSLKTEASSALSLRYTNARIFKERLNSHSATRNLPCCLRRDPKWPWLLATSGCHVPKVLMRIANARLCIALASDHREGCWLKTRPKAP
mmetsp:Transcript_106149/g.274549  ORF Transcript_106149/g.274549 Transcript_106149/m.274549 type:complete len:219 (+) Transcript_106149:264-920(+)